MYKQYIPHKSSAEEIEYVEEVWTEKWRQNAFEDDVGFLRDSDYFKVLAKHLKPGTRLLEGGCGLGAWVRLYTALGYAITGVDLSKATVNEFNRRFPKLDVRVGDVFKLDFPDNTFDAYLSFGVIEHFEDGPAPIIAEARRVLKPGGLFCVSVPFLSSEKMKTFGGRSDNRDQIGAADSPRFYQYFMTKDELGAYVKAQGFEVLGIYPVGADHTLKSRSPLAKGIASSTKQAGGLVKLVRPLLRKAWHFYVGLQSKDRHAHMIFAICKAVK